jgi:hypothetical protein
MSNVGFGDILLILLVNGVIFGLFHLFNRPRRDNDED